MSRWKKLVAPPKGALPAGLVTKYGVLTIAVLVVLVILSWTLTGSAGDPAPPAAATPAVAVDEGMGRSLQDRIRQEAERRTSLAEAEARAERREADAAGEAARSGEAAGPAATPGMSAAESELRESLRLEEVERRARSLRSVPVTQSHRDPAASLEASPGASTGEALATEPAPLEESLRSALASFEQTALALGDDVETEERLLETLGGGSGAGGPRLPAAGRAPRPGADPLDPARLVRPADPQGWERIHEGSFLEAVLVTQLTGDFPGPVLAMVSVPFHSADRQRVLIPRGTRAIGTAEAVQDRDQSRLAVTFHRLVLPDGSWIELAFAGLSQAGESALSDEVDRHYLSTFVAAGAVGVLSGLTLAGAPPYGLQAGLGQGLGQGALPILDRFLNRLPAITIRAGHRLRIWFTSDVLVPRPGTRP